VPAAHWIVADGARPAFGRATFDRVLVDAPCSGLGTLRRRPEIRYRVSPSEIERLSLMQRGILEASLDLVKPGGRLVYAVCTVTPEETTAVVDGLGGSPPPGLPGDHVGDGLLLGPHLGPYDGMFISVFDV
jgi:16S rRNA (cytosine967-C5)-methyltransferase